MLIQRRKREREAITKERKKGKGEIRNEQPEMYRTNGRERET